MSKPRWPGGRQQDGAEHCANSDRPLTGIPIRDESGDVIRILQSGAISGTEAEIRLALEGELLATRDRTVGESMDYQLAPAVRILKSLNRVLQSTRAEHHAAEIERRRARTAKARKARAESAAAETAITTKVKKRLERMLRSGESIDARDVASRVAMEVGCSARHVRDVRKTVQKRARRR